MQTDLNFYNSGQVGPGFGSHSVFTALGSGEVALTKGLAAVFAVEPNLVLHILDSNPMVPALGTSLSIAELSKSTLVSVNAEERQGVGVSVDRRDVTVRFFAEERRILTLIIEAKNTSMDGSAAVMAQVRRYLDATSPLDREGDAKVGLTLTRAEILTDYADIGSMTWTHLVELLQSKASTQLAKQYLTNLKENLKMEFFEAEVYSVPAGNTSHMIEQTYIHAFPADRKAPVALFLAPRVSGGHIPKLYRVERVFDVDTRLLDEHIQKVRETDDPVAKRLTEYFVGRLAAFGDADETLRIFVLNENAINLTHNPRPRKKNNPFSTSKWTLLDLLDSNRPLLD